MLHLSLARLRHCGEEPQEEGLHLWCKERTDAVDPESDQIDRLIGGKGRISCWQQAGRRERWEFVRCRANSPYSVPWQQSHTHRMQRKGLRGDLIIFLGRL